MASPFLDAVRQDPVLADVKPSGRYVQEDLHQVGGTPAVMKYLLEKGLLDGDCLTVTGKTVAENLDMGAFLRNDKDEIKRDIEYIYELFPILAERRNQAGGTLSGGEQQMLAIGMALVVRPKLLLLDEPLLGLSPMMQEVVMEAVVHLQKNSGITVLLSEQFARPVLPVIDRGYVVENGMLALDGTGEELMDNPEIKSAYFGF